MLFRWFVGLEMDDEVGDATTFTKNDTRAPVDELRRRAAEDPVFGLALRSLANGKVSAKEALDLQKKKKDGAGKT